MELSAARVPVSAEAAAEGEEGVPLVACVADVLVSDSCALNVILYQNGEVVREESTTKCAGLCCF